MSGRFHTAWSDSGYGCQKLAGPGWTIDWWRHGRELIDPVDYLTRPYFDQWMQTYAALIVDSGLATVEEIAAGTASAAPSGTKPPMAKYRKPILINAVAASAMLSGDHPCTTPIGVNDAC